MAKPISENDIVRKDAPILARCVFEWVNVTGAREEEDFLRVPLNGIAQEWAFFKQNFDAKKTFVLAIVKNGNRAGSLFCGVKKYNGKKFLHVIGIFSDLKEMTYENFLPELEKIAKAAKFAGIYSEAFRPGVFKKLSALGFLPANIELIKPI